MFHAGSPTVSATAPPGTSDRCPGPILGLQDQHLGGALPSAPAAPQGTLRCPREAREDARRVGRQDEAGAWGQAPTPLTPIRLALCPASACPPGVGTRQQVPHLHLMTGLRTRKMSQMRTLQKSKCLVCDVDQCCLWAATPLPHPSTHDLGRARASVFKSHIFPMEPSLRRSWNLHLSRTVRVEGGIPLERRSFRSQAKPRWLWWASVPSPSAMAAEHPKPAQGLPGSLGVRGARAAGVRNPNAEMALLLRSSGSWAPGPGGGEGVLGAPSCLCVPSPTAKRWAAASLTTLTGPPSTSTRSDSVRFIHENSGPRGRGREQKFEASSWFLYQLWAHAQWAGGGGHRAEGAHSHQAGKLRCVTELRTQNRSYTQVRHQRRGQRPLVMHLFLLRPAADRAPPNPSPRVLSCLRPVLGPLPLGHGRPPAVPSTDLMRSPT